jgi:Uncharacterized protein conserved in bacteria
LSSKGNYIDGKEDGLVIGYYNDGQLEYSEIYKNGIQNGPFEWFHANGKISTRGNFRDGEKDGLLEAFSENGEILMKKTFLNGEVISCEYGCNLRTD